MLQKMVDCVKLPDVIEHDQGLDNVAVDVFDPHKDIGFIHSQSKIDSYYGFTIENTFRTEHNELFEHFNEYGPNEKYVINKILFSTIPIIYLVGGIGVGKTTFIDHFIKDILPNLRHTHQSNFCPTVALLRFTEIQIPAFHERKMELIEKELFKLFLQCIESDIIRRCLTVQQEINEFWPLLIQEKEFKANQAAHFISYETKTNELGTLDEKKKLLKQIRADLNLRQTYTAAILRLITKKFFNQHPYCCMIIVDNIDQEPILAQVALKNIAKNFARISKSRILITARQSTFHQRFEDGMADVIDRVAYTGPDPITIIHMRLEHIIRNPECLTNRFNPTELKPLIDGLSIIKEALRNDRIEKFIRSVCGRSIRRALLLSQNIINNSVYNPHTLGMNIENKLHPRDILRALVVGKGKSFKSSPEHVIENLFQLSSFEGVGYTLKMRILLIISKSTSQSITLESLRDLLESFGYKLAWIKCALNDMMLKTKRLIWTDSVKEFLREEDIVTHGISKVYLSSSGMGYIQYLFKNLDYVQEIMLDTFVDRTVFGKNWEYSKMEERFSLILKFCKLLSDIDRIEVQKFIENGRFDHYEIVFKTNRLFTSEIIESINHSAITIIDSIVKNLGHSEQQSNSLTLVIKGFRNLIDDITTFESIIFKQD